MVCERCHTAWNDKQVDGDRDNALAKIRCGPQCGSTDKGLRIIYWLVHSPGLFACYIFAAIRHLPLNSPAVVNIKDIIQRILAFTRTQPVTLCPFLFCLIVSLINDILFSSFPQSQQHNQDGNSTFLFVFHCGVFRCNAFRRKLGHRVENGYSLHIDFNSSTKSDHANGNCHRISRRVLGIVSRSVWS